MPKPSEFIKLVRHHGWRSSNFSLYGCPVDLRSLDLELAPQRGKQRDVIVAQLRDPTPTTDALLRATLPSPRTTIDSQQLHGSSFVRIALWHRQSYHYKHNRQLLALIHAEYALRAPVDLNPDDVLRSHTVPTPQLVLTLRLLDVYIQQDASMHVEEINEALGWALSDQLFQHMDSLTSAVYDAQNFRDYSRLNDSGLVRVEMQGDAKDPHVATLLDNAEINFRDVCETGHPRYEPFEWLDLEAGVDIQRITTDSAFEQALQHGRTSRKCAEKPPRDRAAPNAMHHLLLRQDPELRWRNGKVINLWRLARMQIQASDDRITAELEAQGIDWRDTEAEDWGPSLEQRSEQMARNPDLEPITWVFVIDDGTGVFAAIPVRTSELSPSRLLEVVKDAWHGQHGLLRGPPASLSVPVAYLQTKARTEWAQQMQACGVELTAPTSGFAAPLHVTKAWCEASKRMGKADRDGTPSKLPAATSIKYVQDWALAHALSAHANSAYERVFGDTNWRKRHLLQGGGYAAQTTIQVQRYVDALGLGSVDAMLNTWRTACHPDFQQKPLRRRGTDADRATPHD